MVGGLPTADGLHLWRWVALAAAAEAVGAGAGVVAVRSGPQLLPALTIAVAIAGGLLPGVAVGTLTARTLRPRSPDLPVRRGVALTLLVTALVGGVLALTTSGPTGFTGTGRPALWAAGAVAVSLGLFLGAGIAWRRATLLRHRLSYSLRWVGAATLAWVPVLAVLGLAATTPVGVWPLPAVLGFAAGLSGLAGAVVVLVLTWSPPSRRGGPVPGRLLLLTMGTRWRRYLVPSGVIGLKVLGRRTGTWHSLPVLAAGAPGALIVLPGRAEQKLWWRNLIRPSRVQLRSRHGWEPAEAWVIRPGDLTYQDSLKAYRSRYPRVDVPCGSPLVRVIPVGNAQIASLLGPATRQARH